jgi:hypothetical protein
VTAAHAAADRIRDALGWARAGLSDAVTAASKLPAEEREQVLVEMRKVDAAIGAIVAVLVRGGGA